MPSAKIPQSPLPPVPHRPSAAIPMDTAVTLTLEFLTLRIVISCVQLQPYHQPLAIITTTMRSYRRQDKDVSISVSLPAWDTAVTITKLHRNISVAIQHSCSRDHCALPHQVYFSPMMSTPATIIIAPIAINFSLPVPQSPVNLTGAAASRAPVRTNLDALRTSNDELVLFPVPIQTQHSIQQWKAAIPVRIAHRRAHRNFPLPAPLLVLRASDLRLPPVLLRATAAIPKIPIGLDKAEDTNAPLQLSRIYCVAFALMSYMDIFTRQKISAILAANTSIRIRATAAQAIPRATFPCASMF